MRIAAIGDSFTEGIGDEGPCGEPHGWADRVAISLAGARGTPLWYANFAIRGRLLSPILLEQLDNALSLDPKPTLLFINGGGNDMMRPGFEPGRLAELTAEAIDRCRCAGVEPVIITGPDPSGSLPFSAVIRRRGLALHAATVDVVAVKQARFIDIFSDCEISNPHYWAADRLHLNALGHEYVAQQVLDALDVEHPSTTVVFTPRPNRTLLSEARFYCDHVAPWFRRRLLGRSSGDGRQPKLAVWTQVEPVDLSPASCIQPGRAL